MNQLDLLQKMDGTKRLDQAFRLSDFVREMAMKNIQIEYPYLSKKQQLNFLKKRLFSI